MSLQTVHVSGAAFDCPAQWEVSEEWSPDGQSVNVAADDAMFCTVTVLEGRPSPGEVLDAAVAAYRETYDECDVENVRTRIAGRPAIGRDVDFFCLELVNSAWLRAFQTDQATVLVLFQASDADQPEARSVFDALCRSMRFEDGGQADVTM